MNLSIEEEADLKRKTLSVQQALIEKDFDVRSIDDRASVQDMAPFISLGWNIEALMKVPGKWMTVSYQVFGCKVYLATDMIVVFSRSGSAQQSYLQTELSGWNDPKFESLVHKIQWALGWELLKEMNERANFRHMAVADAFCRYMEGDEIRTAHHSEICKLEREGYHHLSTNLGIALFSRKP